MKWKNCMKNIDIYKGGLSGCIMNRDGNIDRRHTFPFTRTAIERFLEDIPNAGVIFAIKACGMWRGVYKILTEIGYEVKLANPKKTHDIAGYQRNIYKDMQSS